MMAEAVTSAGQVGKTSWSRSSNTPPFTRTAVLVMVVVVLSVALSLSMPWYKADVQTDDGFWLHNYEVLFYFDYASNSNDNYAREYMDYENIDGLMSTERSLIFAWIIIALLYLGTCLFDGRYSSAILGFLLLGVSTAALVLVAANIGDAASGSYSWPDAIMTIDAEVTAGPGSGYILVLVAFVLQAWAILIRAWYVLPWIADDIRINAQRERDERIRNYHAP